MTAVSLSKIVLAVLLSAGGLKAGTNAIGSCVFLVARS
jgi:hypothetical protein